MCGRTPASAAQSSTAGRSGREPPAGRPAPLRGRPPRAPGRRCPSRAASAVRRADRFDGFGGSVGGYRVIEYGDGERREARATSAAGTVSSSRSSRNPRSRRGGKQRRRVQVEVGQGRPPVAERAFAGEPADQRNPLAYRAPATGVGIAQQHDRGGEGERRPRPGRVAAADERRTSAGVEPLPHRAPARSASPRCRPRSIGLQADSASSAGVSRWIWATRSAQPCLGPGLDVDLQRRARAHHRGGVVGVARRR